MVRNCKEIGLFLQKVMKRLMANQNLVKLLYYTNKDPLSAQPLSNEQVKEEIYNKLIKIIPRVEPKDNSNSIIVIKVDNGKINSQNGEFREIYFDIDVFVPLTQWFIKDENLRPFAILGAIQESLQNADVNGIGKITGGDFILNFLTEEMSCYTISFYTTTYA